MRHRHVRASARSALHRIVRRREPVPDGRPTRRIPRPILGFPTVIFRLRLDRLARHLLLLETRGRVSGKRRAVVLNVTAREGSELIVMSVDGRRADWVRNLMADPMVVVRHRGRSFAARATVDQSVDPGELAVALYHQRPRFVRIAYRLVGERVDDESAVRRLAADRVAVRIAPILRSTA